MMVVGDAAENLRTATSESLSSLPTIQEIKRRGRLRVLVNSYTPRLSIRDPSDGELKGLEIDLAKSLAGLIFDGSEDASSNLEFFETSNDLKMDLLTEQEVDLIISNFTDTPARRKRVDFAGHYVSMRYAPLVGQDVPDICIAADLSGLRVACEAGTIDETILTRIAPGAEIVPMASHPSEWLAALDAGEIQAFWGDTVVDPAHICNAKTRVRQGQLRVGAAHSAIGVNKRCDDLRRVVNDAIAGMLSSGQLAISLRKWGL